MEVLPGEKDKFKHGGSATPTSMSSSAASSSTETYKRKLDAYHTAAFERVNKALKLSDTLSSKNVVGGKASQRVPGSGPQTSPASDAPSSARRSDGGGSTGGNFSPTSSLSPRSSPGGRDGGSRPSSPGGGGTDLGGSRPRSSGGDPRLSRAALSRSPSPAHSDHSGHSCPSPGKAYLPLVHFSSVYIFTI